MLRIIQDVVPIALDCLSRRRIHTQMYIYPNSLTHKDTHEIIVRISKIHNNLIVFTLNYSNGEAYVIFAVSRRHDRTQPEDPFRVDRHTAIAYGHRHCAPPHNTNTHSDTLENTHTQSQKPNVLATLCVGLWSKTNTNNLISYPLRSLWNRSVSKWKGQSELVRSATGSRNVGETERNC